MRSILSAPSPVSRCQPQDQRPTWAQISLDALKHNYAVIKKQLAPGTQLMAVVKADGYGHGAIECARALAAGGAEWFGVALIEEAVLLRQTGIGAPIFCLGGFWRGQAAEVIKHHLTPAIFRLDAAEELNLEAAAAGRTIGYHLKVDTGVGRLGVPFAEVAEFAAALRRYESLRLEGVMTHLADADGEDPAYTEQQIERYQEALKILRRLGFAPAWHHLANSAAINAFPQAHGNLARAGGTLYGLGHDVLARRVAPPDLRPVMSLLSRIVMLKTVPAGTSLGYGGTFTTARESRIATIPIGYADGFRRGHSNNGRVIVRGAWAPIVGRVSMDLTILDVTEIPGVELGDVAVLIGEENGLRLTAEDLAAETGTISYEIATGLTARVPRVYT
ncbi:MAG TPA: alanine racemase [Blastocatellia bacterium]|nr:alanine racemase [Blastocatellia bacterium]